MARITIGPDRPTLDAELQIRLADLPARQAVTVRSRAADGSGRPFAAAATFETDSAGEVDLAAAMPTAGTHAGADPMGLVWSMAPAPDAPRGDAATGILPPSRLTLTAEVKGATVATATVDRLRLPEDVTRTEVREQGLVGTLTQGIGPGRTFEEIVGTPVPSWTWRGKPLPYLRNRPTPELRRQIAAGEPVALGLVFEPGMADPAEVDACAIPVERMRGAALLISSGQDRMWPCGPMSEVATRRLTAAGVAHEHLHFAEAGHPIAPPPYGPATELVSPGPGVAFDMGGTPAANATARAAGWRRVIEFLSEHLEPSAGLAWRRSPPSRAS